MGGNKKNGKKKKKEQEEKDVLTEVDREYYEIQLVDLSRKLNRLRTRTTDLEALNIQLEENLKKLDEDRSDVISYLKKTLKAKTNELVELQERFDGLKQSMDSGAISYKEKIAQMEQAYKNMQEELTSDIKLLMGKLNSLEEFRTQKEELVAKFASQEQKMKEQEITYKENLYQHEKYFIIEKSKLKKQMESRLLQLSLEFQKATDTRIAATTQKMIRENIAINNELTVMQKVQKEMTTTLDGMREKLRAVSLASELCQKERDQALKKSQTQVKIIDELMKEKEKAENKIKELSIIASEHGSLKRKLEDAERKLSEAHGEIKKLSGRLASGQSNAAKLYADIAALKLNSHRLYATLHKAVNAVKEAVRIHKEPRESPEIELSKRLDLLNNLLQILNRAEMSEIERYPTRKLSHCYKKGDLGFIPKTAADLVHSEPSDAQI